MTEQAAGDAPHPFSANGHNLELTGRNASITLMWHSLTMVGPRLLARCTAFAATLLLASLMPQAGFADEAEIGMVKAVKGQAFVVTAGHAAPASIGMLVHQNDDLVTDGDGALGVTFIDNTTLSLGANSKLIMTAYAFEPRAHRFAFAATLAKGSLMWVSGRMTELAPDAVALYTPFGTIGVHGTRFLVKVDR